MYATHTYSETYTARVARKSISQYFVLSMLLHLLLLMLFGVVSGSGENKGEKIFGSLTVTWPAFTRENSAAFQQQSLDLKLERNLPLLKPSTGQKIIPQPLIDNTLTPPAEVAPQNEVVLPKLEKSLTTITRPDESPALLSKEVEKPSTEFVVPPPSIAEEPKPRANNAVPAKPLPPLPAVAAPKVERTIVPVVTPAPSAPPVIKLPPPPAVVIPNVEPPIAAPLPPPTPATEPEAKPAVPPQPTAKVEPAIVPPAPLPKPEPPVIDAPKVERVTPPPLPTPAPPVIEPKPAVLSPPAPATPAPAVAATPPISAPPAAQAAPPPPVAAPKVERVVSPPAAAPAVTERAAASATPAASGTQTAPTLRTSPGIAPGTPNGVGTSSTPGLEKNINPAPFEVFLPPPTVKEAPPEKPLPKFNLDDLKNRAREMVKQDAKQKPFITNKQDTRSQMEKNFDKMGRPNCSDAYAGYGLLGVVPLAKDLITDTGCSGFK